MNHCPGRDLLEQLLENRLVDMDLDDLDRHVNGCASCQRALEELTGDPIWKSRPHEASSSLAIAEPSMAADPLALTVTSTDGAQEQGMQRVPTVPGYEITGELGRGGMGVVYKARHIRLNRPCALKMILAGAHAGPDDVARFVTEAVAIARLAHPSIVQIRHIGDADGLPFLELEYVAGGSLDRQLDGTPWPPSRAAQLVEQLALGIAEAHHRGIVHRDLKPSNVLVASDGTPKVGDFGLAKMLDGQSALTRSESVMGSPSYMAPEQALGHAKGAGPVVDVYAMGAILYELLTGRPPFRGTTALETIEQVKTTDLVPPSRLVQGVPRDIETICLKCLQKEPGKRYETARALGDDLRRFVDGRPILARRIGGMEQSWRWCRRNRFVAGMIGIAASAIISLAVVATLAAFTFRTQRDQLRVAERQTQETLLESRTAQARAIRFGRRMGQRFESLDALDHATQLAHELEQPERFDRIRDQAIASFALPDLKPTGLVIEQPAGTQRFCFDPDMKRYAIRLKSGTILVRMVADDREVARFQVPADRDIPVFSFSPDGRYLATTRSPGPALVAWDLDRNAVAVSDPGPVSGTAAGFSPDGRRIAVARDDGEILVYDLKTGRPASLQSGLKEPKDLAFRADGLQVAVTNDDKKQPTCLILGLESGNVVRSISLRSRSSVAWSPDGSTLATTGGDLRIDLWDVSYGIPRERLEGSTTGDFRAAFHPAGRLLASTGRDGRLWLWDSILGRPVLSLVGTDPSGPVFSRDGRIVLSSEGRLTAYQVDPALDYRALIHPYPKRMFYMRPSVRSDGRLLAVASNFGVVLWDLARGTVCDFLKIGLVQSVMFEPNGDLLTSGATGVRRWPVHLDADRGDFRIGPPLDLPISNESRQQIAQDRLGRITAAARDTYAEVVISGRLTRIGPLRDCRYVDVSPDGEWLVTGSQDSGALVWRVSDAKKLGWQSCLDRWR